MLLPRHWRCSYQDDLTDRIFWDSRCLRGSAGNFWVAKLVMGSTTTRMKMNMKMTMMMMMMMMMNDIENCHHPTTQYTVPAVPARSNQSKILDH